MNMQITDILRRIENLIRTGSVIAVNGAYCRVETNGNQTDWLRWITARAGNDIDWWPPSVGEPVLLFSLGGELTTSFVLTGIYSDDNPPPSQSLTARTVKFADGTIIEYEQANSTLQVSGAKTIIINNAGTVSVNAGTKITLNAPVVECTQQLITQSLSVTGGGTMTGNINHSGGSMTSNGIVLHQHRHTGVTGGDGQSGGPV